MTYLPLVAGSMLVSYVLTGWLDADIPQAIVVGVLVGIAAAWVDEQVRSWTRGGR